MMTHTREHQIASSHFHRHHYQGLDLPSAPSPSHFLLLAPAFTEKAKKTQAEKEKCVPGVYTANLLCIQCDRFIFWVSVSEQSQDILCQKETQDPHLDEWRLLTDSPQVYKQ